jgi:hypothetical protein
VRARPRRPRRAPPRRETAGPARRSHGAPVPRYLRTVPRFDDDDWVGEPPEGRHTRDRARPEHWRDWRASAAGAGIAIGLVVLLIVLLL